MIDPFAAMAFSAFAMFVLLVFALRWALSERWRRLDIEAGIRAVQEARDRQAGLMRRYHDPHAN